MKSEAMNGSNILPIMKLQHEQKSSDSHEMNGDEEELPDAGDGEDSADGKNKKKQTRKKRSLNWEEAERGLLLEVIKSKVVYVENRSVEAKNIKAKRLAWMQITKQFNALNFRHRSLEQIQVQWRAMKNTGKREYQNKHPKSLVPEGPELVEFMEEMQKEPSLLRLTQRGNVEPLELKKEEPDLDEDLPLAALPSGTASDESSSLQPTTAAVAVPMHLPSPPPSGESQTEIAQISPVVELGKKKWGQRQQKQKDILSSDEVKQKRKRNLNACPIELTTAIATDAARAALTANSGVGALDEPYKKELFELLKRTRLAEMDFARREHEQKLRQQQLEQELKMSYYRKQEELKLQLLRAEHEQRMHHYALEHESRMRAYDMNVSYQRARQLTNKPLDNTLNSSDMDMLSN